MAGDRVTNPANEDLGKIEDIMIDLETGSVAYAVLSFGGFLGMGDKLFAVPWSALELDINRHEFILDIEKSELEEAPGFDKDNWPNFADEAFGSKIHTYYGQVPYWERARVSASRTTVDAGIVDDASRERLNQPDLPEELRRRPVDVSKFPGSEKDADLRASDPSRTYAVNDTTTWTRKA
jgi:hypothetical protein